MDFQSLESEEKHLCQLCGEMKENVIKGRPDFITLVKRTLGYINIEFIDDIILGKWLCANCLVDAESADTFLCKVQEGQRKLRQQIPEGIGTSEHIKSEKSEEMPIVKLEPDNTEYTVTEAVATPTCAQFSEDNQAMCFIEKEDYDMDNNTDMLCAKNSMTYSNHLDNETTETEEAPSHSQTSLNYTATTYIKTEDYPLNNDTDTISELSGKIEELKNIAVQKNDAIESLKSEINANKDTYNSNLECIKSILAEQTILIQTLSDNMYPVPKFASMFPIKTQDELDGMESFICAENQNQMVDTVLQFIKCGGFKQNLLSILGQDIILQHNMDGKQGKMPILRYAKLMKVFFGFRQTENEAQNIEVANVTLVNNNDTNVKAAILKALSEIKKQLQRSEESNKKVITKLTEEIISLRTEVKACNSFENDTSLLPALPFLELADLKEFDDKLLLDDNMRSQLNGVLRKVGGQEIPQFVRSALKQIVSDELAINLTWRGTAEKPSIQNFHIFSIIKDACHTKFQNSTDSQINKVIQQHFLHAKDRVLKRKRQHENSSSNLRPVNLMQNQDLYTVVLDS